MKTLTMSKLFFYCSSMVLTFLFSILLLENILIYFLFHLLLIIIFWFIFHLKKTFHSFILILILTSMLGVFFGKYNFLNIKTYLDNSHYQSKILFSHFYKKLFKFKKQDMPTNESSYKEIEIFEELPKDSVLLMKRQNNEIELLNADLKKEEEFAYYSSILPEAVPFAIFDNSDLLVSSAWWDNLNH